MRGKVWLGFLALIVLLWAICLYALWSSMSVREIFVELGHHVVPSTITMIDMKAELNEVREETLAYILKGNVISEGKTSRERLEELYRELKAFAVEHREHESVVGPKARGDAAELANLSEKLILASTAITELKDRGAGADELVEMMDKDFHPVFVPLRERLGELIGEHQEELSAAGARVHDKHDANIKFIPIVGILATLTALVIAFFVDRFFVKYRREQRQAEEDLRKEEERWRSITENSPDHIMTVDIDHNITFINRTVPGVTREEMIGKSIYNYIPEKNQEASKQCFDRVLKSKQPDKYSTDFTDAKDITHYYEARVTPLLESDKLCGFTITGTDITERKKIEEELQKRTHDLGERVKELRCLYGISRLVEKEGIFLEEILEGTPSLITPSWQYPEITCARIVLEGQEFKTNNFRETVWRLTSDIAVHGKKIGTVEVFYLEEKPMSDEGPFLKEERNLIDAIAERLGRIIERKRMENELRIKEEAIASSVNAITLADLRGNLTYVNQAFLHMWGYSEDKEVLGKPIGRFLDTQGRAAELMEALRNKKSWMGELAAKREDGSTFDVQLLANIVENEAGKAICMMASVIDITERKKIEQMKSDFVALASHELRTPLTSIVGYVDLILDEDVGKINKEQKEFLQIISQNTQRLEALINGVLDIEKIESGRIKMKTEKVNLNEIAEACIDTFKVMAEGKGLKLEKEIKADRIEVLGDSDRLSQVFSNLLSNAIKYTKEGGVKLTIQTKGRFASVTIEDTGLGMSQDELRSIFARFFRSEDSYVRKATGSGLGLSIAKSTIERHNGDIKVESKLGAGSKFEVILPLLKQKKKAG